ncbi:MAG: hypothetical protein Q4G68_10420 [Planctomycetia bacterium]|nr:hypothetical protein [Planctomycetia bacterium]
MSVTIFNSKVRKIFSLLQAAGATDILVVGGVVRDYLMSRPSKDIDIEVYGLSCDAIINALRPHLPVNLVGRSFGVLKVGSTIDISLPRRESKMGSGHKGFAVESIPTLSLDEAFARRDFTINAMGMRIDGSLVDLYGGQHDLANGILRACSAAFKDDPLRVLRAMQFASRFGFSVESRTLEMCREVRSEFPTLSAERLWDEWQKWARQGRYPSKGLAVLEQCGWLDCFPELSVFVNSDAIPCWQRTKRRCDLLANVIDELNDELDEPESITDDERQVLLLASLGLESGEAEGGVSSATQTCKFLNRLKAPVRVTKQVEALVRASSESCELPDGWRPTPRNARHLAHRVAPSSVLLWCCLQASCRRARDEYFGGTTGPQFDLASWLLVAKRCAVMREPQRPYVLGRHLIELGVRPGVQFGELLTTAYRWQLDGEINSTQEGITRLLPMLTDLTRENG